VVTVLFGEVVNVAVNFSSEDTISRERMRGVVIKFRGVALWVVANYVDVPGKRIEVIFDKVEDNYLREASVEPGIDLFPADVNF